jgi:hypothetical protein
MANLPPFRLKSRKPLWKEEFLMQPFSKSVYWKAAWQDVDIFNKNLIEDPTIVIYEPSAGRRCSRMSAFFKARATKERVPLINARMNGRCLHASGSYNIFCTKIKLNFFVLIH